MRNTTQHTSHCKAIDNIISMPRQRGIQGTTHTAVSNHNDIVGLINGRMAAEPLESTYIDGIDDYFGFAKQLNRFVGDMFPEDYEKLSFDANNDNVMDFIKGLTNVLFANGFFLEVIGDGLTMALTSIDFPSHLYIMDAHNLCNISPKPLKIGYAHLLNAVKHGVFYSILDNKKITNLKSTHIEMDEDIDDVTKTDHLRTINKVLRNFHKYYSQDLQLFFDYRPKSKANKELKATIEKGLGLDYGLIKRLADDQYRDEALSFGKCFQMSFDCTHPLENIEIEYDVDYANWHGCSDPCIYYALKGDGYSAEFSDDAQSMLNEIINVFNDIYSLLNY